MTTRSRREVSRNAQCADFWMIPGWRTLARRFTTERGTLLDATYCGVLVDRAANGTFF
jgi:hypothetical protein